MSCPIPHELLVRYWADDLEPGELDAVEEHLFGCADCSAASARVAALARGIAELIPPVVVGADIARAEERGVHTATNEFRPGIAKEAWLNPGTDLLLHRLLGDLEDVDKVSVEILLPDGSPLVSFADVPFEPDQGAVIIACQRHFVMEFSQLSNDIDVVVRRQLRDGGERRDTYSVLHRIGPAS